MRNFLLVFMVIMGVSVLGFAQKGDSTVVKTQKKIIIKTMDNEGNENVKIIEGQADDLDSDNPIQVDVNNDSVFVRIIRKGMETSDSFMVDEFETFDMGELENFEREFGWEQKFPGPGHRMRIMKNFKSGPFARGIENKGKLGVFIEETSQGVKVTEVEDYSSAYSVGIFAGDVITKVNGVKITNVEELQREIASRKPGDMVKIQVRRNGKNKSFEARLHGQEPDMDILEFRPLQGGNMPGPAAHGFMFMDDGCRKGKNNFDCGHGFSYQNCCSHEMTKGCGKHESEKQCCSSAHKSSGCSHDKVEMTKCSHGEAKTGCKGEAEKQCCSSANKSSGCSHDKAEMTKCSHGEVKTGCKGEAEKKCCSSAQKSSGCSHENADKAKCSHEDTKTGTKQVEEKKSEVKKTKESATKPSEKK